MLKIVSDNKDTQSLKKLIKLLEFDFEWQLIPYSNLVIDKNGTYLLTGANATKVLKSELSLYQLRGKIFDNCIVTYNFDIVSDSEEMSNEFLYDLERAAFLSQGFDLSVQETKYKVITTVEEVKQLADYVRQTGVLSYDFEAPKIDNKGLNYFGEYDPTSLSISFQVGSAYVIPLFHNCRFYTNEQKETLLSILSLPDNKFKEKEQKQFYDLVSLKYEVDERIDVNLPIDELRKTYNPEWLNHVLDIDIEGIVEVLKDLFEDASIEKIAHNNKFDAHILRYLGIDLKGVWHDTMLMSFVIKNTNSHGLKNIVSERYPYFAGYDKAIEEYKWTEIPIYKQAKYNAMDTDLTLRVKIEFENILLTMDNTRGYIVYRNIFMAAQKALFDMESKGMLVNRPLLEQYIKEAYEILATVESELKDFDEVRNFETYQEKLQKESELLVADEKLEKLELKLKERTDKEIELLKEKSVFNEKSLVDAEIEKLQEKIFSIGLTGLGEKDRVRSEKQLEKLDKEITDLGNGIYPKKIETAKQKSETYKQQIFKIENGVLPSKFDKALENIELIKQEIRELKAGVRGSKYGGLNISSPAQVGELLYGDYGFCFDMPYDWRKREKVPSTSKDMLTQLDDETGFIKVLLKYKSIKHTINNFLEGILSRLDKNDRVHTSFKQMIETGRLSSSNPNLQNIPPEGRGDSPEANKILGMVKRVFIPEPECEYREYDLSQAELRVMAMYANELTMLAAYNNGEDLHAKTAASLMNISLEEFRELDKKVQKLKRFEAKSANFGLLYGLGAKGFMEYAKNNYGVEYSMEEAEAVREKFLYETYPALVNYHDIYKEKAKRFGGVYTFFGYKRWLPEISSSNDMKRNHAENAAVNTPIQGTAGQYTIFVLSLLRLRLPKEVKMINTVHDSIHFYIPKNLIKIANEIIMNTFENPPLKLYFGKSIDKVKMVTDASASDSSWGELIELK